MHIPPFRIEVIRTFSFELIPDNATRPSFNDSTLHSISLILSDNWSHAEATAADFIKQNNDGNDHYPKINVCMVEQFIASWKWMRLIVESMQIAAFSSTLS